MAGRLSTTIHRSCRTSISLYLKKLRAITMKLIIKLLNDMAASHPEETALNEQGHALSFAGLKKLVDTLGQQLFDDGADICGQHIENMTSCRIFALCAEH